MSAYRLSDAPEYGQVVCLHIENVVELDDGGLSRNIAS